MINKKIAFGDNSKMRFSVVRPFLKGWESLSFRIRKVFYTFLYHKKGFTPLESPAIYCGDEKYIRDIIPLSERTRYKAPSFLTGFTLIELLIVVIIIGILASLALPNFGKTKENALDKQAISNLKLIQPAEKGHYLEMNTYYPSSGSESNVTNINNNLKLSLTTTNWTYTVWSTGCGRATRNGGDGRSWYFRIADNGSDFTNCTTDGEPNKDTCYTCS